MIVCNKDIVKRDGFYQLASDDMIERDREACIDTVPVSLCNGFNIPLEEIFYNLF